MSDVNPTAVPCPSRDEWLHTLSAREAGQIDDRPDLQAHLDGCTQCRAATADVRRFQTLLLRGRPSGLNADQRHSLDERVHMLSGRWDPPTRSPWLVWGVALSAATVVALLAMRPFEEKPARGAWQDRGAGAVSVQEASAGGVQGHNVGVGALAGVVVGAVDGDVEVAGRDGQWSKLVAGAFISDGARLRSSSGGRLTVAARFEVGLEGATEVELLAVREQSADWRLRQGAVACQVDKLRRGQRFAVMFGAFRASVMGTRFVVRQLGDGGGGQVLVTEGAVRVDAADEPAAAQGETTTVVRAGQRWRHAGGVMSLDPIPSVADAAVPAPVTATGLPMVAAPPAVPQPAAAQAVAHEPSAPQPAAAHLRTATPSKAKAAVKPRREIVIEVPQQSMPQQP